ncbi:hypothetical protein [Oceanospirillum phage vB_OsaM_PD0307]|nr:hypothetical protein [Oceanospirillum phage vB_OsaM_PD0307]
MPIAPHLTNQSSAFWTDFPTRAVPWRSRCNSTIARVSSVSLSIEVVFWFTALIMASNFLASSVSCLSKRVLSSSRSVCTSSLCSSKRRDRLFNSSCMSVNSSSLKRLAISPITLTV